MGQDREEPKSRGREKDPDTDNMELGAFNSPTIGRSKPSLRRGANQKKASAKDSTRGQRVGLNTQEAMLARFGVKNAADVWAYRKSDQGKVVDNIITQQNAILQQQLQQQQISQQQYEQQRQELQALLLGLVFDKDKTRTEMNDQIAQQQIDRQLHTAKESTPSGVATTPKPSLKELADTVNLYKSSEKALTNAIEQKDQQTESLVQQNNDLQGLKDTYRQTRAITDLTNKEGIEGQNNLLNLSEEQRQHLNKLEPGLLKGIPENKQIVEQNGQNYLIGKNETLDELQPEAREQAQSGYQEIKPELNRVNQALNDNQNQQEIDIMQRTQEIADQMNEANEETNTMLSQCRDVRAARERAESDYAEELKKSSGQSQQMQGSGQGIQSSDAARDTASDLLDDMKDTESFSAKPKPQEALEQDEKDRHRMR